MKYKILREWMTKDKDTGLFTHYKEVDPEQGGKSEIIKLTVDSGEFTNTLRNGWHSI